MPSRSVPKSESLGGLLGRHPVSHLHWGGGTPSTLGPDGLFALREALDACFDLGGIREHAIELDPRHVTTALVHALACIGVNRASLGVQDLSPHVQKAIGRIQPYDTVARSVELLHGAGIDAINFDLMYGLPRQTVDDVRATMEKACALGPQRIALFGYAHVPWFKKQQRLIDVASLPGAGERLEQMQTASAFLASHGYEPIGFDHFALPNDPLATAARQRKLRRNFQGYTTDGADTLIGIGASAIGRLPEGFVQNAPDIGGYARAVGAGTLATVRGFALSSDDRLRAEIIERLMCDLQVDLRQAGAQASTFAAERECLEPLVAEGLVRIDGPQLLVTERGRPFVRLVAAAFDSYLAAGRAAHSRAV